MARISGPLGSLLLVAGPARRAVMDMRSTTAPGYGSAHGIRLLTGGFARTTGTTPEVNQVPPLRGPQV